MRRKLAAATALVLALAAGTAPAAGRVESKVTLALGPHVGQFGGVVKADRTICVSGRRVKVIRVEPAPKTVVARDFSDINGIWSKRTGESSGSWYAKVTRERRQGVLCLGDRSALRSAG